MTEPLRRWLAVLTAAVMILLGHDTLKAHEDGEAYAEWYRSLQTPVGGSCCSMTDCQPTEYRVGPDGYEVWIDQRFPHVTAARWETVPPGALLRRENPTGGAVACYRWNRVLCFIPPSEV